MNDRFDDIMCEGYSMYVSEFINYILKLVKKNTEMKVTNVPFKQELALTFFNSGHVMKGKKRNDLLYFVSLQDDYKARML